MYYVVSLIDTEGVVSLTDIEGGSQVLRCFLN